MKKILIGVGIVLGVLVIAIAAIGYSAFGGLTPLVDATELPGGARTIKDGFVASFLLPVGDHAVALVDCGNDPKGGAILAELSRRGLGPEAVKAVFLTHGHSDHLGACHLFDQAKIYAFSADIPLAMGTGRAKGPLPRFMDTPTEVRVRSLTPLEPGVPVVTGTLTVTPYLVEGHTAGSAAYLANGSLFVGDSMAYKKDGTVRPCVWAASDSTAENHASLVRLATQLAHADVKSVVPAHSGPGTFAALAAYTP